VELSATVPAGKRLVSIDLLRGITIAFMILVNNNGDGERAFWALKHTQWNGFTPTDLVVPTFLFLVGVSLVFSTESRLARGASRSSIALHAVRRSVILFLLGLVVNGYPAFAWGSLRIYGVLQRIFTASISSSGSETPSALIVEFIPVRNAGHDFEQVGPNPISRLLMKSIKGRSRFSNAILAENKRAKITSQFPFCHSLTSSDLGQ
jgi:hypothetical protein